MMSLFQVNYKAWSDEQLMSAIADKADERAFTELYRRYATRLYRFFLRMLWGDKGRAEDFTQEIFLKIVEKSKFFDANRSFSSWIFSVATNLCKNEYRKKYPQLCDDFTTERLEGSDEFYPESLDYPLYEQQLQQAIDQLEWPQRQCFILRYQEGLSLKEVSEIVDCAEGTVKSRLHYALKKVSQTIEIWKNHA